MKSILRGYCLLIFLKIPKKYYPVITNNNMQKSYLSSFEKQEKELLQKFKPLIDLVEADDGRNIERFVIGFLHETLHLFRSKPKKATEPLNYYVKALWFLYMGADEYLTQKYCQNNKRVSIEMSNYYSDPLTLQNLIFDIWYYLIPFNRTCASYDYLERTLARYEKTLQVAETIQE